MYMSYQTVMEIKIYITFLCLKKAHIVSCGDHYVYQNNILYINWLYKRIDFACIIITFPYICLL